MILDAIQSDSSGFGISHCGLRGLEYGRLLSFLRKQLACVALDKLYSSRAPTVVMSDNDLLSTLYLENPGKDCHKSQSTQAHKHSQGRRVEVKYAWAMEHKLPDIYLDQTPL